MTAARVGTGDRRRRRRGAGPARAAAVVALLAGCGLTGCGRDTAPPATAGVTAAGTADAAPDPGSAPVRAPDGAFAGLATALAPVRAAGGADPVDQLQHSMLGPRDLGPGWTGGDPPVPDAATPAPCGGPGTVARFPDALRVGSTVDGPAAGLVVQEALSVYGDTATAQEAFRASVTGLDCRQGTLHGAPVAIAPAQDSRADVGGDQAARWRAGSDAVDAVLVVVQARQAVFTFAYVTPTGTAPAVRPDPVALSRAAVSRALAA